MRSGPPEGDLTISNTPKMRDLLAIAVAGNAGAPNFVLDPRGEIAAVTMPNFAMRHAYEPGDLFRWLWRAPSRWRAPYEVKL